MNNCELAEYVVDNSGMYGNGYRCKITGGRCTGWNDSECPSYVEAFLEQEKEEEYYENFRDW